MKAKAAATRLARRLLAPELQAIRSSQDRQRVALGALTAKQIVGTAGSVADAEFSAFSQFGEDGVIEFLIQRCDIHPETFIEIGVEDYAEANTRFLAEYRGWRGVLVDLNPHLEQDVARTHLNWRAGLQACSAFITRDNVREVVRGPGPGSGVGLLSIDIDGVDYWVLERLIDLGPAIIVVEYNSLFGSEHALTVPYSSTFDRRDPAFHNVYYGASLGAFDHLLSPAGYALVGCTSAGNNAFFVKHAILTREVQPRTVTDAFRARRFVEHRDSDGNLTGLADVQSQLWSIGSLPLIDLTRDETVTVAEVLLN